MNSPTSVRDLAVMVGGEMQGDPDRNIIGLAPLGSAVDGEITFITRKNGLSQIEATSGSAVIVPEFAGNTLKSQIKVIDPNLAAAIIHTYFCEEPFSATGIHPSALIGSECEIPSEVSIGSLVVLGNRVRLGKRVTIGAGVVIGDDVEIGDDTVLFANVTILFSCQIGNRVRVHSGTVIGADGFGYATDETGRHVKRPQVGIVRIDDDVEIGANVCIDRATFGVTRIHSGVKIDNLVQVGHNVIVGSDSLLVAQMGIAGSSTLGQGVIIGGQAAIADHKTIGDRVMIGGQSGVINNQKSGSVVTGTPAIAHRKWLRASSAFARLPEIVNDLKKEIDELRSLLNEKKE